MESIFYEPIRNLPEADIPLDGIRAYFHRLWIINWYQIICDFQR